MRRKQAGITRGLHQVGVKTKHDVSLGGCPLKLHTPQNADGTVESKEIHITGTFGLERFFNGWARPPFRSKGIISVDCQFGRFVRLQ